MYNYGAAFGGTIILNYPLYIINYIWGFMERKSAFGGCHPAVIFAYFIMITGFTMSVPHPITLGASLFGAVCYYIRLYRGSAAGFFLKAALPMTLLAAVINSLFNHRGDTVLFLLPTGNKLTLESVIYGLAAAVMLVSVLTWFGCFSRIMTSDKLVYLFGRLLPSLSLVSSMILRFVPHFSDQLERIKEARQCMGQAAPRSPIKRLKNAFKCFSVMITWSLEDSIDTADSMKSRGYGLRGRTSYSMYTFTERDKGLLAWIAFCSFFLTSGVVSGNLNWQYFPKIIGGTFTEPITIALEIVFLAASLTPLAFDFSEDWQWRTSRSKI